MPTAIVTGSGGLIGSESVNHFIAAGFDVVGLENDMRAHPDWHLEHHIESILGEIHDRNVERRTAAVSP